MDGTPDLSVIIPTYQRRASVERVLTALTRQTLAADAYEVIVVMDGSTDGTRELVAGFPAPYAVRGVWQPNRGRAAARNAGIRAAAGSLSVLFDDDMEPSPGCLDGHRQAHARDRRLGVLGAAPVRFDRSSPPVVRYIGSKFNRHLQNLAQTGRPLALRDFYSGNFSIRRDVLLEVGLFDEDFKLYGNEDLELSLRLTRCGVRLEYSPAALAYQHYEKDFAGLARDNLAKGRTAVQLATKHPETFAHLRLSAYKQASRKWRVLRASLLALTDLWARTPQAVIRCVHWLELRRPAGMNLFYGLALDYFYWQGVRAALREARPVGRLDTLIQSAGRAS